MAFKRAKWIEGITQSKRILKDIAEIACTALKDENGVIDDENWQLVYPRPFREEVVTAGPTVKDTVNTKKFVPVKPFSQTIVLVGTTAVPLTQTNIVPESVVVRSGSTVYSAATDYTYDSAARTVVRRPSGSTIADGAAVTVTYGTRYPKILESMPVSVSRKLTLADPDRVIEPINYDIVDYTAGKVKLKMDPPADAMYLMLTFTENTGIFGRTLREKVELTADPLDPTGRTFQVPPGTGAIMLSPDTTSIASAVTGLTGQNNSGTFTYTLDVTANPPTVTFNIAPTLTENDILTINAYYYDTVALDHVIASPYKAVLVKDVADVTNKRYLITHPYVKLNENKPHNIDLMTINSVPALFKHLDPNDAGWEEVGIAEYAIDYAVPSVTFTTEQTQQITVTFVARDEDDLDLGLGKVTDRIVLKTTTKPEGDVPPIIGDDYGAKDTADHLDMYVEIRKPVKLINPETGLERYTLVNGSQAITQDNNHYIQVRMFDRWNDTLQKFQDPTYNSAGAMTDRGAYVSDWTKYAWFRDWKEYLVDELDTDPGSTNFAEGVRLQQVVTTGMSEDFPIQFWLSTNNNRLAMILMGEPSLDQDNFLTSFGYFGRISPFYTTQMQVKRDEQGEIVNDTHGNPILEEVRTYFENDTSGNFALTAGSSTVPADIGTPPTGQGVVNSVSLATESDGTLIPGRLFDNTHYTYAVTYLTEGGESRPTPLRATVNAGYRKLPNKLVNPNSPGSQTYDVGASLTVTFTLPEEATGYKLYRSHYVSANAIGTSGGADIADHFMKAESYRLVTTVTQLDTIERTFTFHDDGAFLTMERGNTYISTSRDAFYVNFPAAVPTARSFESVVRDVNTGSILEVKFSSRWGRDTATGVNDIMMYQTRSGLKYQRHQAAFITTDEFMRKERSGQSRWTGKFHLSPVYIEHSYDKQRGWLDGVMAVDDSGIEHLDELIVDKDTPNEEVYKFFRINAPYSFLNNSPNASYGVAIIKSSQKWE